MPLATLAASSGIGRTVADQQQVGIRRTRDLQVLENDGSVLHARGGQLPLGSREVSHEFEALGHRAQDGVRLDGLDLSGEELIGVVGRHARGVLADDGGGSLPVDVDGGGGFVDGGKAGRDYHGGGDADQDEGDDSPFVAAENPQVVGEGDDRLFGFRLGITVRGLERDVFGNRRNVAVGFRSGKGAQGVF